MTEGFKEKNEVKRKKQQKLFTYVVLLLTLRTVLDF